MALNTYMTYLMKGTGSTFEKLVDVKETPDIGGANPTLDSTTLSDPGHTYIDDIYDTGGGLEFTANYTKADYEKLKKLEGTETQYAIWYGASESDGVVTPDGSAGKWEFKGLLSVWPKGSSVGAVREMGISIAPTTEIKPVTA